MIGITGKQSPILHLVGMSLQPLPSNILIGMLSITNNSILSFPSLWLLTQATTWSRWCRWWRWRLTASAHHPTWPTARWPCQTWPLLAGSRRQTILKNQQKDCKKKMLNNQQKDCKIGSLAASLASINICGELVSWGIVWQGIIHLRSVMCSYLSNIYISICLQLYKMPSCIKREKTTYIRIKSIFTHNSMVSN